MVLPTYKQKNSYCNVSALGSDSSAGSFLSFYFDCSSYRLALGPSKRYVAKKDSHGCFIKAAPTCRAAYKAICIYIPLIMLMLPFYQAAKKPNKICRLDERSRSFVALKRLLESCCALGRFRWLKQTSGIKPPYFDITSRRVQANFNHSWNRLSDCDQLDRVASICCHRYQTRKSLWTALIAKLHGCIATGNGNRL